MNAPHDPIRERENPDPHEGRVPIPIIIIVMIAALLLWALIYITRSSSNDSVALGDRRTADALRAPPAATASATTEATPLAGAPIFQARCVACHQATGTGIPGVFPPLAKSSWALAKPDIPVQIVLHGVQGPLTVNGATFNGVMPAFKDVLSDAEIAAVLSYVRTSWGNSATLITTEQVAATRQATSSLTAPFTGDAQLQPLLQ